MVSVIPTPIKIALALAGAVAVFSAGWEWRDRAADLEMEEYKRKITEANLRASERAREVEGLMLERAGMAAELAAARQQKREFVIREVDREVIKYVQTPVATECGPDVDFVLIHDAAATGGVPKTSDPAARANAAAAEVTNADLITIVAGNYGSCQREFDRIEALQDWVQAVQEAWQEAEDNEA